MSEVSHVIRSRFLKSSSARLYNRYEIDYCMLMVVNRNETPPNERRVVESDAVLSIKQLSTSYGSHRVLNKIDLEILPGQFVALAGDNGAGKTTLLQCISGEISPTEGQIVFAKHDLLRGKHERPPSGLGVVWQNLALCDNLKIAENLLLGVEKRRFFLSPTRTVIEASALLRELQIDLGDISRPVRSLSGGQRQLLAIARAMRTKPNLLILDEPTSSLGMSEAMRVEELVGELNREGAAVLLASHDIDQMFRLADRIDTLRHGEIVASLDPETACPDDVIALVSGHQIDSNARRQLIRLHRLVDRLSSDPPSSSLPLILSSLGSALSVSTLAIHLLDSQTGTLRCETSLGLTPSLAESWLHLPVGSAGGPIGMSAATGKAVMSSESESTSAWATFRKQASFENIHSCWTVPIVGSTGVTGVITVCRSSKAMPTTEELDLITLYAGYVTSAIERDRLLSEATSRNCVLETVREMLETLAGPEPLVDGMVVAVRALQKGLQSNDVGLWTLSTEKNALMPWFSVDSFGNCNEKPLQLLPENICTEILSADTSGSVSLRGPEGSRYIASTFKGSFGKVALIAEWKNQEPVDGAMALIEDAAHSLQLALDREQAELARQEALALRRSQELQLEFLFRLSHELRTPLTAIRGYASSLMQADVTWDVQSKRRFLARISTESTRLGHLVDDLLDFSSIESGTLRLQWDWCEVPLIVEAAMACLSPLQAEVISTKFHGDLVPIWGDHDRLEQVFVNILHNAVTHNPPGTLVEVDASISTTGFLVVDISDDGIGVPENILHDRSLVSGLTRTSQNGLGLSIAKGIVEAHGGRLDMTPLAKGSRFSVHIPIDQSGGTSANASANTDLGDIFTGPI